MLSLHLYIHGAGSIAPAGAAEPVTSLRCVEPDYSAWIPPMQLRRMSRIVRMGIGAARVCLDSAGIPVPDALSAGTAMGCLQDTEAFLSKMVAQEERLLTPTAFIQSTHNTVAGQIALLLGCHGHNMTYVHRGHSFEYAVINTALYLADHPEATVLAGGIDELTDTSLSLMQRAGIYREEPVVPSLISASDSTGAIAGEGASFFAINKNRAGAALKIKAIHLFTALGPGPALEEINAFMRQEDLPENDIDLVILGMNGDARAQPFYTALRAGIFSQSHLAAFKHVCGEYATASAFALSLLTDGVMTDNFPQGFFLNGKPDRLHRILMINNYLDHGSIWLLEAP